MFKHTMIVGMAGAIVALGFGTAEAQSGGQAYCNDGCLWTLVCEDVEYDCGSNEDGTTMRCTKVVCYDKCEFCPGDYPVDLDTLGVPHVSIDVLPPFVNPVPF